MHRYSGAKQIFYQTNVLVSAQHGCRYKVATGNPREPHDFVRLVWLQQEDVPLEIKKLVTFSESRFNISFLSSKKKKWIERFVLHKK